jgi:phosphoglycolate phosphatase
LSLQVTAPAKFNRKSLPETAQAAMEPGIPLTTAFKHHGFRMKESMDRFKAVIYDCDGVIFDSFEANLAFYNRIMAMLGRPPLDRGDGALMRVLHTFASQDVLRHIFPDETKWRAAMGCVPAIDYRELVPYMRMEEGFRDTIETLSSCVGLAICTNRAASMNAVLEAFDLGRYFGIVMTALKVTNPKPHPEPLLKVLDHYRIAPGEALFVGDSEVDRQAAEAAGVPFIAYKTDLAGFARIDRHLDILPLLARSRELSSVAVT